MDATHPVQPVCTCDGRCPMTEDHHWINCPIHTGYAVYLNLVQAVETPESVIVSDDNTRHLFEIRIDESGSYLAIRTENPYFCFSGSSIPEVCDQAVRAFDSYRTLFQK